MFCWFCIKLKIKPAFAASLILLHQSFVKFCLALMYASCCCLSSLFSMTLSAGLFVLAVFVSILHLAFYLKHTFFFNGVQHFY